MKYTGDVLHFFDVFLLLMGVFGDLVMRVHFAKLPNLPCSMMGETMKNLPKKPVPGVVRLRRGKVLRTLRLLSMLSAISTTSTPSTCSTTQQKIPSGKPEGTNFLR